MDLIKIGLVFLAVLGVLIAVGKIAVRVVGAPCQFCENRKLTRFGQLPSSKRRPILGYFRSHEGRDPDTSAVFVCVDCMTVHDDFSGEKRSMDIDMGVARTFCKVCNALMQDCDPDNEDIRCVRCGTHYRWQDHADSGFRFLMPPQGAKILERCQDVAGIG